MKKIVLCSRPGGCCPGVYEDNATSNIIIYDDYGGKVRLTKEEFKRLKEVNM